TVILMYLQDPEARGLYPSDARNQMAWIMEALRLRTFVFFLVRLAALPVEVDEWSASPGDVIWLSPAAANRDPDVFSEPTLFDPATARAEAPLLQRLALMDPAQAWSHMMAIRDVEISTWETEVFDTSRRNAAAAMRLAPSLCERYDLEAVARDFARWKLYRF